MFSLFSTMMCPSSLLVLSSEQDDRLMTTRPMKGDDCRGLTNQTDLQEAAWLEADPKKSSRNMMIVISCVMIWIYFEIGSEQVLYCLSRWPWPLKVVRPEVDRVQTFGLFLMVPSQAPKISTINYSTDRGCVLVASTRTIGILLSPKKGNGFF